MRSALLALACFVSASCGALPSSGAAPTVTPAVTAFVIPTRSPAPSVSPTRFLGRYGYLVSTNAGYVVRREDDPAQVALIDLDGVSVSPDGRRVAGFTRSGPAELQIREVASPRSVALATPMPEGERGLFTAWSVDGGGVVYSVLGPSWSALRTLDLVTRAAKVVARIDGVTLRPVLWDRPGGDLVGAFAMDGDAAREYVMVRGAEAAQRKALPDKRWRPAVSGDERWIVIAAANEPVLRTFQADDPGFVVETHGTTDAGVTAIGRPMSGQIGIVLDGQLLLWDPATGLRQGVPTETVLALVAFRFDGSAAIVRTASGPRLVEIASGRVTPLAGDATVGVALP